MANTQTVLELARRQPKRIDLGSTKTVEKEAAECELQLSSGVIALPR
jgi:hypothetical protein